MIRAAQKADEPRRLREQTAQLLAFGLQQPGTGHYALLQLLQGLPTGCRLTQRIFHCLQLGNVRGVLQNRNDLSLLIQDWRVRGAPVTILVNRAKRRLSRDGVTNHRQRIDCLAAEHPRKRIEQLLHSGHLGTERIGSEGFMKALPLDIRQFSPGKRQVSGIRIQNDQVTIKQDISIRG